MQPIEQIITKEQIPLSHRDMLDYIVRLSTTALRRGNMQRVEVQYTQEADTGKYYAHISYQFQGEEGIRESRISISLA